MMQIRFTVNGTEMTLQVPPDRRLVDILREDLGLTATKIGCGEGECGACTVIVDGKTVDSCLLPACQLEGRSITTLEGITPAEGLHPIQQAFMEQGAVQCGFCIPGMVLAAKALLDQNPSPSEGDIRTALSGNLCRCTGYVKIVKAVEDASRRYGCEKGEVVGVESR